MGDPSTATRRLNLAQAFNPIGSLLGMFCAMNFIQARLHPLDSAGRAELSDAEFEAMKAADLSILSSPYILVGLFVVILFLIILFTSMPKNQDTEHSLNLGPVLKRLLHTPKYREGVIAQFFYVGAQIMCWTFIIQYGTRIFMNQGMSELDAEVLSQRYNIAAMVLFCISRFICTFLLKYISPGRLLSALAIGGCLLTAGVIGFQNIYGLYCLVAVLGCMSLMFPTIYGIALEGLGDDAKFGAAGLIMAILGGSVMPPLQALIIDGGGLAGIPSVHLSFIIPLLCFVIITIYGYRTHRFFSN